MKPLALQLGLLAVATVCAQPDAEFEVDALANEKRTPLGTMRFGKRSYPVSDDDEFFDVQKKVGVSLAAHRDLQSLVDDIPQEDLTRIVRAPLGTMRFGKRSTQPLGSNSRGDLVVAGTMRFGKREMPLGTMRFGKRSDPLRTMRFGKRAPLGTMRFGRK